VKEKQRPVSKLQFVVEKLAHQQVELFRFILLHPMTGALYVVHRALLDKTTTQFRQLFL
jgi:hypothetical protein